MPRSFFASCVLLSGLLCLRAHAQAPPDEAEFQSLVETMRESALAFDSRLPDFICFQTTRREVGADPVQFDRSASARGRGPSAVAAVGSSSGWNPIDRFEQELTYFGHKESYRLVRVDGKPAKPGQQAPAGAGSSGEFGTTLRGIFEPESHAQFAWKRAEKLRGRPVQVFSYDIAKENSSAQLVAGSSTVVVAYRGLIYLDRDSKTILRITTEADTPPGFPLQRVTHVLDYGRVTIAGEQYVVPLHAEMQMRARREFVQSGWIENTSPLLPFRNTIDFRSYRKYGADSVIRPE